MTFLLIYNCERRGSLCQDTELYILGFNYSQPPRVAITSPQPGTGRVRTCARGRLHLSSTSPPNRGKALLPDTARRLGPPVTGTFQP